MIEIKNLAQVIKQIDQWEAEVNQLVAEVGRGLSVEMFKFVVDISPQYSGDFAANWKYMINAIDTDFVAGTQAGSKKGHFDDLSGKRTFREGDRPAINTALRSNAGRETSFKLGDTAFFSNSAEHDDAYAPMIWNNQIKFRPVNDGIVKQRFEDKWAHDYALIDAATAHRLRKARIV